MTPGQGGFFGLPFPNDIRVDDDGTVDMAGYPGRWHPIANTVIGRGEATTTGFGTNAPVYFTFSAPLATASLPPAAASTATDSAVMLVNLDSGSPEYGERVPVATEFDPMFGLYKQMNTLAVMPYPGFTLNEGTRYAAVLFDGLRSANSTPVKPAGLLAALAARSNDSGTRLSDPDFTALADQYDDVARYVAARTDWEPANIVAFTVFTTQTITPKMAAMTAAVDALDVPEIRDVEVARDCAGAEVAAVDASVDMPRFQAGISPYLEQGGHVEIGGDGLAVVQFFEPVKIRVAWPCREVPADGWPVIVHIDGTGSTYRAATENFADGYYGGHDLNHAVISVTPFMTEDRLDVKPTPLLQLLTLFGLGDDQIANLHFFNFLNPVAGANNLRQMAAEATHLKRVAQAIELDAGTAGAASGLTTNDADLAYYGHSQGALSAPLLLATDDEFDAAFVSAGGGGMQHAVQYRGDVRPLLDSVFLLGGDELDSFHPITGAVQLLAEAGDPSNYADDMTNAHVVLTAGHDDGCSPREGVEHLAAAAGLPVAAPNVWDVFAIEDLMGRPPEDLPLRANLDDGRTGAMVQFDAGHFGAQANPAFVRTFFDTLAETGVPTLSAGPFASEFQTTCFRYN